MTNSERKDYLENLSKDQLIRVIGVMHDTIQTWDSSHGVAEENQEILQTIGDRCSWHCYNMIGFGLEDINL